jgi:hypothetical protein
MGSLGKEERLWADWYEGGQRRGEGHFVEGKEDGFWTFWFRNGQKSSEGNFVRGMHDGCWRFWYSGGQKKKENNWKEGEREGVWVNWDKKGITIKTETYKSGVLVVGVEGEGVENEDDGECVLFLDSKEGENEFEETTINHSLEIECNEKLKSDRQRSDAFDSVSGEHRFKEVMGWFDIFNFTVVIIALGCLFITFIFILFL